MLSTPLLIMEFRTASEVALLRQRTRQLARLLGFDTYDQTRICAAVSEIVRNAYEYANGGRAEFSFSTSEHAPDHFVVRISDSGPGIPDVTAIMAGSVDSKKEARGLRGASNLMDTFHVNTAPGNGTTVELGKALHAKTPKVTSEVVARIARQLGETSPLEESRMENAELVRTLESLRARDRDLDRLYREATEAVAAREHLLAVVSHDLRNPLEAILVGARMLVHATLESESDRARKSAESVLRSAQRMERLVADLLDFAQIQSGRLVVEPQLQDASALIRDCLDMLGPVAAHRGVHYNAGSAVQRLLRCDKERVLQILSNLVGNAIKFTPEGGRITITAVEMGDEAQFTVTDTGPGIGEEALPHIFDPFWRANRRTSTGVGLGLSITKSLVEAHGGRVWAESKVGVGTSMFFTLPLGEASLTEVRKVRITKKFEQLMEGIDPSHLHVGEVIAVPLVKSPTLIAEGLAVPEEEDDDMRRRPAG